jgi:hypothetical protein
MTEETPTPEVLFIMKEILLREHRLWVEGLEKGERGAGTRLDLSGENLRFVRLCRADLRGAHAEEADFTGANLRGARGVELQDAPAGDIE